MPRSSINFKARKRRGPSTIIYRSAKDESGHNQLCVYAECQVGGSVVGPIWGHAERSVKKALATLTRDCDCPARFHRAAAYEGQRIHTPADDS